MLYKKTSLLLALIFWMAVGFGGAWWVNPSVAIAQAVAPIFSNVGTASTEQAPVAAAFESALQTGVAPDDSTVRIDGTRSMVAINRLLKQAYEKQFPGVAVKLDASTTEAALQKLQDGEVDLAAIARPLTAAEVAQGLKQIPISLDKIAIIVGRDNPFNGVLTVDQVAKIFRGEITDWAEVGGTPAPIRLIHRPAGSDTRWALSQYGISTPGSFVAGSNATQVEADDTAEVIKLLRRDGISYAIASQLSNQTKARLVKIGVIQETLPDDTIYPYAQARGYAYQDESLAIAAFLNYASGSTGQAAVAAGKLAEAKAIAAGGVAAAETAIASETARQSWLGWLWLFLPLIGLGLILQALVKGLRSLYPAAARSTPDAVATPLASDSALLASDSALPESQAQPVTGEDHASFLQAIAAAPETVPDVVTDAALETGSEAIAAAPEAPNTVPELRMADSSPNALYQQSLVLLEAGEFAAALPMLDELVAATPSFANAWASRGEALVGLGQTEEAQISFNCARDLDPTIVRPGYTVVPIAEPFAAAVSPVENLPAESTSGVLKAGSAIADVDSTEASTTDTEATITDIAEIEAALGIGSVSAADPSIDAVADLALSIEPLGQSVLPLEAAPVVIPALNQMSEGDSVATLRQSSALRQTILDNLSRYQGKTLETSSSHDLYMALAYGVRDRLFCLNTPDAFLVRSGSRIVGEFSAEYLPGPHLANNLLNLDLTAAVQQTLSELGTDLQTLVALDEEPGLGRGGLGRLMMCYLDSLATANVPAIGYGIRYEYGLFDQELRDGWQVETADEWLRNGNPWELERPDAAVSVLFGGHSEAYLDAQSQFRVRWVATETIRAIPYDTPIPGYQTDTVNLLRLWKAESAENLSQVLYPSDSEAYGRQIRLKQQFFFVSASLQDILRQHLAAGERLETLSDRFALQLNDTDPIIAIPELMRLLMDEHGLAWDDAWGMTQQTFAYTNHSLLPEALDAHHYALPLLHQYLPRHHEIILGINCRFLSQVRDRHPDDQILPQRLSIIDERGEKYVRMVNLACVGTHAVNGVSAQHTALLIQTLPELAAYFPDKFSNITNGITPRRFLALSNPRLAALISSKLGNGWLTNLTELVGLEPYATDAEFCNDWQQVKQLAKQDLANYIQAQTGIEVDPASLFDVQATEIHEYKRQALSALHLITLYNRIKANPQVQIVPRTVIVSGKAAPDYFLAKLTLKLITAIADTVNTDPDVRGRLKLVFLKDLTVRSSQLIFPAADLVEQIAPAGTDACATGSMMAALNGALLLGTPDGSNLELRDAVGAEQVFWFGLTADAIAATRQQGYQPSDIYASTGELQQAIATISSGTFSNQDGALFQPLVARLLDTDPSYLLADYAAYVAGQYQVAQTYRQRDRWTQMSILTTARMGQFSSDRAIQEYCQHAWSIPAGQVQWPVYQEA